jgi:hypothetical protein
MAQAVATSAMIACSFGTAPATLSVLPQTVMHEGKPAATIMDSAPMLNIPPFAMCTTPSNPTVAAATTAALGVLTPMPCVPVTTPWSPGCATVMINNKPALNSTSMCNCAYGGVITISFAGTTKEMIP